MQELTKEMARTVIRERLKAMTASERAKKSEIIADKLMSDGVFDTATTILLYKALPSEVNVDSLIDYCIALGKSVYLPRVNGELMDIVLYSGRFSCGAYGVQEPIGDSAKVEIDLAIVPLLGISTSLNRLGKGKGYYDKFLANSTARKAAVAFDTQVLDNFAVSGYDIDMDICYTDIDVIYKR